jgi:hypothetical protein
LTMPGMVSKVLFQLEEGMEPFAVAGKNGCSVAEYDEGGCLRCRHSVEFPVMIRDDPEGEDHRYGSRLLFRTPYPHDAGQLRMLV